MNGAIGLGATLTDVERLSALDEADRTFQMTEEAFRAFYDLTARPLWNYLARISGDARLADDLLQETYYRFLRSTASFESWAAPQAARPHQSTALSNTASSGCGSWKPLSRAVGRVIGRGW